MADPTLEPDFWKVTWQFEGEPFETLRAMAQELTFNAEDVIFSEGDKADALYLVLDGYALVTATNTDTGEQETISIIAAGQSFGELALLIQQPRRATIVAGTDLKVLKVSIEVLDKLEGEDARAAAILYKELARTLSMQLLIRADRAK